MLNKEQIQAKQQQLNTEQLADASRYHRVFVQNEEGAKLLAEWVGTFMFGESCPNDASLTELAMKEGRRQFVAMITQKISLAENPHD